MRRFSHWEYIDRRTFWGWRREWCAVYAEDAPAVVVEVVVQCEIQAPRDPELCRIERETKRLLAVKEMLDAEAAVLRAEADVLSQKVELAGVRGIARRAQPELLPYLPQVPMQKSR
jgi:hypothetical protein